MTNNEVACLDPDTMYLLYKGYYGSVQYDEESAIFFGHILFINDLVTYECPENILFAFKDAVDNYLETCAKIGKEPNKTNFDIKFTDKELESI